MSKDTKVPTFSLVIFKLPDARLILQRRSPVAPYAPGKLGFFGGWLEAGETPYEGMVRELEEETSLIANDLAIKPAGEVMVPASEDFDQDRHFHMYETTVKDMSFEIFEGTGAEAFSLPELKLRTDLAGSAKYIVMQLH